MSEQDLSQQFAQMFGAYAPTDPTTPGFNPNAPDPRLRAAAALGARDPRIAARQQEEDEAFLRQDLRAKAREMAEAKRPKGKGFWNALKKGLYTATDVAAGLQTGLSREDLYYKQLQDEYKTKAPYISKDVLAYEAAESRKAADAAKRETEMLKQSAITDREMRKLREKIAADAGLKAEQAAYFAARTENMDVKTDADKLAYASMAKFYKEHGVLPKEIGTAATAALELGDKPEALANKINWGLAEAVPKGWLQYLKPGGGGGGSTRESWREQWVQTSPNIFELQKMRSGSTMSPGGARVSPQETRGEIDAMVRNLTGKKVDTSLVPGYQPNVPEVPKTLAPDVKPAPAISGRPKQVPQKTYRVSDFSGNTYALTPKEFEERGDVFLPKVGDELGRRRMKFEGPAYNRLQAPRRLMDLAQNVKYSDLLKYSGPLANHPKVYAVRSMVGSNPVALSMLDAATTKNFSDITLEYSGKQVSDKEREFLAKVEANMKNDGAELFLSKLAYSMIIQAYDNWTKYGDFAKHGGLAAPYRKELEKNLVDRTVALTKEFVDKMKRGEKVDIDEYVNPERYLALDLNRLVRRAKKEKQ